MIRHSSNTRKPSALETITEFPIPNPFPVMPDLENRHIAILATDGFERSELEQPLKELREAGADVDIVSVNDGSIRSWDEGDWSDPFTVDVRLGDATVDDYDALVLPGGTINPDKLRRDENAVSFVRRFVESGKPVAAICHGPWMLVEADVLRGRRVTSFFSIRTDVKNAGAEWIDREVVVDGNLITSRNPDDLPAFIGKIMQAVAEPEAVSG